MARIEDLLSPPDPEFARAWSPEDYVGHYVGPDAAFWNALNQTPPEVRAVVKERTLDPIKRQSWTPEDNVPRWTPEEYILPRQQEASAADLSWHESRQHKFSNFLEGLGLNRPGAERVANLANTIVSFLPGATADEIFRKGPLFDRVLATTNAIPGSTVGRNVIKEVLARGVGKDAPASTQSLLADALAVSRENLSGLPTKPLVLGGREEIPSAFGDARKAAYDYTASANIPYNPPKTYQPTVVNRAEQIAKAFGEMRHAPDDKKVRRSYDALIDETAEQYKAIKATGLNIEFIKPGMADPYLESPRLATRDIRENNHLWVFPSESGFGTGSHAGNPMLRRTGEVVKGRELLANDMFRIVHDYFGHVKEGVGFRNAGEENAWRSHAAMYSDAARPAMTTETRGQNSWLNYGPHGAANRTASAADTVYSEQKVGLLPKWVMEEGAGDPKFAHLAERYPAMVAPESRYDKKRHKWFPGKVHSPEEEALLAERAKHQIEIDAGRYDPYYDVSKRADVDPANYPTTVDTTRDALPKMQKTRDKYSAEAYSEEATARLEKAYLAGKELGGSDRWYFLKQLEDDFVKEYGEKVGRQEFKQRIALPMAGTTAGASPADNLLSALYGNFLRQKGQAYPKAAYEVPSPVGGQYITDNLAMHKKVVDAGDVGAENAKRHNFAYNLLGHRLKSTIDKQMSDLFKEGMSAPPGDSYGIFEGAIAALAKKHGVDPREFQEVAWGGHKAITKGVHTYDPHPLIQTINEAIERTHRLTGMAKEEIVRRGIIRSEIPIYGVGGGVITPALLAEALNEQ